MGWWGIGGDDIMGDHPADVIGEALQEMAALAAKKGLYNVALGELTAAFTSVVERAPKLIEDLPRRPEVAGEQLNAAIRERLEASGFVPVERSELGSDVLFSVLWRALRDISQTYLDCEIERPPRMKEVISAFTFVLGYKPEKYLALIEPVADRPVYHPLLGAPRLTGSALLERCSPEARETVHLAWRIARLQYDVPLGPRPRGHAVVGPIDLLRALSIRGELAPLAGALALSPEFESDTAALRSLLHSVIEAPISGDPPELDPTWGLSLAALLASRPGTLDVAALIGGLSAAALSELIHYDERFADGLITEDDGLGRLEARQLELAGWGAARPFFGAHLDRGGELDKLTESLKKGSAVVIETDALPLVECLAQAWAARAGMLDRLPFKPSPAAFSIDSYERRERWGTPDDLSGEVLALSESPDRRELRALFETEPESLRARLRSPAAGDVLIVAATEMAIEAASKVIPELREVPRVELAPLGDGDLIAAWLCQRARAALARGETYSLMTLIEALNAADEQDRRTLDWKRLRPWRDVPSRAMRAGSLRRLARVLRGKGPISDVKNHLFVARYIQSEERLKYLLELEKTLP